jgi:hypothetical protein
VGVVTEAGGVTGVRNTGLDGVVTTDPGITRRWTDPGGAAASDEPESADPESDDPTPVCIESVSDDAALD